MTRLDGADWQLRGCLGAEWEWHVGRDKPWDAPGWLPARVPGSVVDDLWRAGAVENPYHERGSLLAEWVPERAWVYRRRIRVEGERGWIVFDGVDHAVTVLLDGVEAARHASSFRPLTVEVPGGEHLLAVVVHPAPESEPQVGRTSRVRVHKSRMGYGWDFCPRMVHQGIWRSVTLHSAPPSAERPSVRLENGVGVVEAGGRVLLEVDSPELWWPNGLGEPRLYEAGSYRVGFRTVELADDYSLVVNGERVAIRGWNWVPLDALYGVPRPEKLEHLLGLAARANVNLLRVWGGGLIETDEFYELCDRAGIMVWQEFSMSSSGLESVPSQDAEFVRVMEEEARDLIPRRRHHPSLVAWGGGNELDADGTEPVLRALRAVVEELDPGRAWIATSPSRDDRDEHGPWEHQGLHAHTQRYDDRSSFLHSEFGVEGMTNRRALEALISPENRWPADRSNPVYAHLGAWWNNAPLVQAAFGRRLREVETLRRASQWLQYDGLRYAVEATLRRGAGAIPWQLNESYPNAWCTSAVDYHGRPKPAFYGVARAYRARHPSARFATWAWGGADVVQADVHGGVPARILDLRGAPVAGPAEHAITAALADIETDVFLLDLDDGRNRYVMTTTETLEPLLDLPRATLEVVCRPGGAVSLRNAGDVAAVGVVLEDARPLGTPGWLTFEDNVLDLLPGETRTIAIDGAGDVAVSAWNVEETRVTV